MSRTTIEIPVKGEKAGQVFSIITDSLRSHGFLERILADELVWTRGNNDDQQAIQYAKIAFTEQSVLIQVWLKAGGAKQEMDLSGGISCLGYKNQLSKILDEITMRIETVNNTEGSYSG